MNCCTEFGCPVSEVRTVAASVAISVGGALVGLAISARWPALPEGPLVVLCLFAAFLLVWAIRRVRTIS